MDMKLQAGISKGKWPWEKVNALLGGGLRTWLEEQSFLPQAQGYHSAEVGMLATL